MDRADIDGCGEIVDKSFRAAGKTSWNVENTYLENKLESLENPYFSVRLSTSFSLQSILLRA